MEHAILSALLLGALMPQPSLMHSFDEQVERDFHSTKAVLATGRLENFSKDTTSLPRAPWPVKVLSIGHTMASYQNYGAISSAYFHHGLDIRADAGSPVIASRGGKVVNIENYQPGQSAYWEIAILDDDGFLWQYHHIERSSIPQNIHQAYANKTKIADGTKIGEVFSWGIVSFGERYHHVHLNILGANKEYLNPFAFLEPLHDTKSPEIGNITLTKNGKKVSGNSVQGNYSIAAELKDLILSEVYFNPPNEIKITVDSDSPQTVWKFDKLPGGPSDTAFVNQFFVSSMACGNYSCRKPVIDLGFKNQPAQVFPLTKGNHDLKIEIWDFENNYASKSFSWTVK